MSTTSQATASKPATADNLEYHLHTGDKYLSPLCLVVGAPGRVEMIGDNFFANPQFYHNEHRGLVSCTGEFQGVPMSVVTHGMGGASTGIILPEAVRSGARVIIRVGSCGSLIRPSKIGQFIIVPSAIRFDGASDNWAPLEYPAAADWRVTGALVEAAERISPKSFYVGVECTTSDFNEGQGRPGFMGDISERMKKRHAEVMRLGAACYSMEAATLFTWCATQAGGLPSGAINAIYANRITNKWGTEGDELAAEIALHALLILNKNKYIKHHIFRRFPK